jgi:hypothetical protein
MAHKLQTEIGQAIYRLRKCTVIELPYNICVIRENHAAC